MAFKAQMSFGKILDTISAPNSTGNSPHRKEDEKVEKRGLLDIDLNVAPPQDDGSESPRNGEQIRSEEEMISCDVNKLNFNGISDEKSENRFGLLEEEERKGTEKEEKQRRRRRWNALLEVSENALRDYEQNHRNKEEKVQNRKRSEIEIGGSSGLRKPTTRKKVAAAHSSVSFAREWNCDGGVSAEDTVAAPLVVRSTRGRAVAMPNKYRDSVLEGGAVAEAEFHGYNKSRKSATVVPTKRKSR